MHPNLRLIMRQFNTTLLLATIALVWSCATLTTPPVKVKPGDELYSSAGILYKAKAYEEALQAYREYLSLHPSGRHAPASMLRMGILYRIQGDTAASRRTYAAMINRFPDSPLVMDARIGLLATYYHDGDYAEVISRSAPLLQRRASRSQLTRIHALLGDAYSAQGSHSDSVFAYAMAYRHAREPESGKILVKLKTAIEQLTLTDIISLLSLIDDEAPRSYLFFQLGAESARLDEYDEAARVLADFVENFPRHEYHARAVSLLEELERESTYNRYTIGCLLPLSGRYQIFGERVLKGIELALARFGSENRTPPPRIIVRDTESNPSRAELAVKELAEARVAAIIGPITAMASEPVVREAQQRKIPIITLIQKADVPESGDYVLRNFLTPRMQAETIASYATGSLGLETFAILYPDENDGRAFMNLFWDEAVKYGGRIVGVESYDVELTDFSTPIKKLVGLHYEVPDDLKENESRFVHIDESMVPFDPLLPEFIKELTGPLDAPARDPAAPVFDLPEEREDPKEETDPCVDFEAIFIPDAPKKAGLIIPQLAFRDIENIYLFGTNLWYPDSQEQSDTLIAMARDYVQGAVMPAGFFPESAAGNVREFVENFRGIYAETPGFMEAIAYDTAMILFQTVSRPEVRFRQTIRDELLKLRNFPGVTGLTSFDSNGEVRKQPYLLRIKRNRYEELRSLEADEE